MAIDKTSFHASKSGREFGDIFFPHLLREKDTLTVDTIIPRCSTDSSYYSQSIQHLCHLIKKTLVSIFSNTN